MSTVAINTLSTLDSKLKQWLTTDPVFTSRSPELALQLLDVWLSNMPSVAEGVTMAKLRLPAFSDPLAIRARKFVIEQAIPGFEKRKFRDYASYASAGSFDVISEEQFVAYLGNKSTRDTSGEGLPNRIRASLLPNSLAALVDTILTKVGVHDAGFGNQATLEVTLRHALGNQPDLFSVKNKYAPTQKTPRVPTKTEIFGTAAVVNLDAVGAIRSAHCDNNKVLGQRTMYTLAPAAGATRANLYYLWIELLTSFDKNQSDELNQSGLWPKLDAERRAVARIAYVEFTAGQAHTALNVPKARLVYDYVANQIFVTVHYDSPNHLEYLNYLGVKPYFKVDPDSRTGTDTVTA